MRRRLILCLETWTSLAIYFPFKLIIGNSSSYFTTSFFFHITMAASVAICQKFISFQRHRAGIHRFFREIISFTHVDSYYTYMPDPSYSSSWVICLHIKERSRSEPRFTFAQSLWMCFRIKFSKQNFIANDKLFFLHLPTLVKTCRVRWLCIEEEEERKKLLLK